MEGAVATDIAFALVIVALLGNRVPPGLKVLILAFAAVDDIGGVFIIAFVFAHPSQLSWIALIFAGGVCMVVYLLRLAGVRRGGLFIGAGILLVGAIYLSGVAYAGARFGLVHLPEKLNWHHITGMGLPGGIGFTVALFIAELAFLGEPEYRYAQSAILIASAISGVAGYFYLRILYDS